MKLLIHCDNGAAPACAQETKRYLEVLETGDNWVLAEGEQAAIAQSIWYGQTMLQALLVLQPANEKLEPKNWPHTVSGTFAVKAPVHEENEEWGAKIKEATELTVDLDKPDNIFVPFNNFLCLSLTKKDMRKREYRVFTSNTSLRATIAASTLRLAGYTGKEALLLPYENDGTLAIEAAFMATHKSPFSYEGVGEVFPAQKEEEQEASVDVAVPTVQFLKAVQKNAKIAGVFKSLVATKADLDWIDTKYDEHSMDLVVAQLPASSKRRKLAEAKKIASELAYQAKYVLKPKGRISVLTLKKEEHEDAFASYKLVNEVELEMGSQKMTLLTWEV